MRFDWLTREWPALALCALFLALGIVYTWLAPPFSRPDEVYHYDYAAYLASRHDLPVVRMSLAPRQERPPYELEAHQPPLYYLIVVAADDLAGRPVGSEPSPNPHYLATAIGNHDPLVVAPLALTPFVSATSFTIGCYVSLLFGALTLLAGYAALRTFLPVWLASAAIAFLAFDPQFLFIATSFSNDVASVAFATLGILVVLLGWKNGPSLGNAVVFGIVTGLGTLTKVGDVALPFLYVPVVLAHARRVGHIQALLNLAVSAAIVLAMDGVWFLRNLKLYGEPFAVSVLPVLLGRRTTPMQPGDVKGLLVFVWKAYWLDFSPGAIYFASTWVYWLIGLIVVVGAIGFARVVSWPGRLRVPLLLLGSWFAIFFAGLLRLTTQTSAPMGGGRLLFPAALSVATIVSVGLAGLFGDKLRETLPTIAAFGMFAFAVLAIPFYLIPAAPQPVIESTLSRAPDHVIDAELGDAITLVGYGTQLSPDAAAERVNYDWLARIPVTTDYSVFLQAIVHSPDGHDSVLAQVDTYPSYGSAPTSFWRPGWYVVDQLDLPLKLPPQTGVSPPVLLITGLYDDRTGARLKVGRTGPAGRVLYGDVIILGSVERDSNGRPVVRSPD